MQISDYDFFVFDCDGVILDSNIVKTNAFRLALSDEPKNDVDKLIEFHLSNGGITRQKKFEHYFYQIKHEHDPQQVISASNRFAKICEKELMEVSFVPGIESFLRRYKKPSYVVTGGNELEVIKILKHKGVFPYFQKILGNPNSKDTNMSTLNESNCFKGRGLYFGDAALDYQLATKYGLDFMFISGYSDWQLGLSFCNTNNLPTAKNFNQLI